MTLSIVEYLRECINAFGEVFNSGTNTPARPTLFETDKESRQLDDEKKDIFHHIVAKLLFMAKRARPDIDLTFSYLCSRVDKSTEEDWGKLRRLLHYINGTLQLKRTLSMRSKMVLKTWVDASLRRS